MHRGPDLVQWTQHMQVRDVRGQTDGPGVEGGSGEDWFGDKDNLFLGSNLSDQGSYAMLSHFSHVRLCATP